MAPKEKLPDLEEMPEMLRKSLVKLMASENLDYGQALNRTGLLLEPNSQAYQESVNAEANSRYKKRFLGEMNKARATMAAKSMLKQNEEYERGFSEAQSQFQIAYRCSVCKEPIDLKPWSDEHKALIGYMIQHGWHHTTCVEEEDELSYSDEN